MHLIRILVHWAEFSAESARQSPRGQAEPQRPGSSSGHGRFSRKASERGMRKELRCRNSADRWVVMGVLVPDNPYFIPVLEARYRGLRRGHD